MPILHGYIDETGDRGFGAKASPLFGLTAVLVPAEDDPRLTEAVTSLRSDFGITDAALHWSKHCGPSQHDRRRHAARRLATVPNATVIHALLEKTRVVPHSVLQGNPRLTYNYLARFLFERIGLAANSWPGGPRWVVARVAHMRGHDPHVLLDYLRQRVPDRPRDRWVPWELATSDIAVGAPAQITGLQAADVHAGILNAALWPDRFGHTDHSHLLATAHQLWRQDTKILGYGIKLLGDHEELVTSKPWWPLLSSPLAA